MIKSQSSSGKTINAIKILFYAKIFSEDTSDESEFKTKKRAAVAWAA